MSQVGALTRRVRDLEAALRERGDAPRSAAGPDVLEFTAHEGQRRFLESQASRRVLACHRRWGKDWVAAADLLAHVMAWRREKVRRKLVPAVSVVVVYPSYHLSNEFWRVLLRMTPASEVVGRWESWPRRLHLKGDVEIELRSAQDPGRLIAGGVDLLVLGEAGELPEASWQVAQPMLANPGRANKATFQGTPRGQNHFARWWDLAADPAEKEWWGLKIGWGDELANPHIAPEVVEQAKREMSSRWYQQEWMADFLTTEGAVFSNVRSRMAPAPDPPKAPLVAGLDLARRRDFTCLSIFDADGRQVHLLRIRELAYVQQAARLTSALGDFGVKVCVIEVNSIGDPFREMLQEHLDEAGVKTKLVEFTTTSQSKAEVIEKLVVAFERGRITLLPDEVQANEFEAFESSATRTGRETFAAAGGGHDDTVMACALAFSGLAGTARVEGSLPSMVDARRIATRSSYGGGLYASVKRAVPTSRFAHIDHAGDQFTREQLAAIWREQSKDWHPDSRLDLRRKK